MKSLLGLVLVGVVVQGGDSRRLERPGPQLSCVATERMPILGLIVHPTDHMPVDKPDSAWHSRMPIIRLVPCYLADSLPVAGKDLNASPYQLQVESP